MCFNWLLLVTLYYNTKHLLYIILDPGIHFPDSVVERW